VCTSSAMVARGRKGLPKPSTISPRRVALLVNGAF
jgi:hypothetical protein